MEEEKRKKYNEYQREYQRKYREEHREEYREKAREYNRVYREKHREEIRQRSKERRENNGNCRSYRSVTDDVIKNICDAKKAGKSSVEIAEFFGYSRTTVNRVAIAYKCVINNDKSIWDKEQKTVVYVPRICKIYNLQEPLHEVITVQDMLDEIDKAYPKEEPRKSKTLIGWLKELLK